MSEEDFCWYVASSILSFLLCSFFFFFFFFYISSSSQIKGEGKEGKKRGEEIISPPSQNASLF